MRGIEQYGKFEGLTNRLRNWKDRLSKDRTLPWVGLGIIADIDAAIARIEELSEPGNTYEQNQPALEFDL